MKIIIKQCQETLNQETRCNDYLPNCVVSWRLLDKKWIQDTAVHSLYFIIPDIYLKYINHYTSIYPRSNQFTMNHYKN